MLVRGPLKPALLASTALPGVFPIVHHDGRRLVDGGVVDNVPLSHALAGPVDRVFVLNVSSGTSRRIERSPLDVVMTSFTHARSQRFELELRHVPPEIEVVVLPRPSGSARPVRLLGRARSSSTPRTSSPTKRSTRAAVPTGPGARNAAASAAPPPGVKVAVVASMTLVRDAVGWRAWRSRACRRARCRGRAPRPRRSRARRGCRRRRTRVTRARAARRRRPARTS